MLFDYWSCLPFSIQYMMCQFFNTQSKANTILSSLIELFCTILYTMEIMTSEFLCACACVRVCFVPSHNLMIPPISTVCLKTTLADSHMLFRCISSCSVLPSQLQCAVKACNSTLPSLELKSGNFE